MGGDSAVGVAASRRAGAASSPLGLHKAEPLGNYQRLFSSYCFRVWDQLKLSSTAGMTTHWHTVPMLTVS